MLLREISSCSCLTAQPVHAWVLLSKTYKHLFAPLYSPLQHFSKERICHPSPFFSYILTFRCVGTCTSRTAAQRPINTIKFLFCASASSCLPDEVRKNELPKVLMHSCSRLPLARAPFSPSPPPPPPLRDPTAFRHAKVGSAKEKAEWGAYGSSPIGGRRTPGCALRHFGDDHFAWKFFWRHSSEMAYPTRSNLLPILIRFLE